MLHPLFNPHENLSSPAGRVQREGKGRGYFSGIARILSAPESILRKLREGGKRERGSNQLGRFAGAFLASTLSWRFAPARASKAQSGRRCLGPVRCATREKRGGNPPPRSSAAPAGNNLPKNPSSPATRERRGAARVSAAPRGSAVQTIMGPGVGLESGERGWTGEGGEGWGRGKRKRERRKKGEEGKESG